MSTQAVQRQRLSVEEYLEFERESPVKHEYVGGMIYALAGVTRRHSQIVMNISWRLAAAAQGRRCRVHAGEVKLQIGDIYYYPDIIVACGGVPDNPYLEDAPCVVVEVTSPSTEATDRREKLIVYSQIPELRAYLIVNQDDRRIERHWRDAQAQWQYAPITGDGSVPIPCPEMTLSLDEIYADLT